jgi:hypothetical protein
MPHLSAMQPRPGTTETLARFVVDMKWQNIPAEACHEASNCQIFAKLARCRLPRRLCASLG